MGDRTVCTPAPGTMQGIGEMARAGTREITMAGITQKRGITATIGRRGDTIATMTITRAHMRATTGTAIGMFRQTA